MDTKIAIRRRTRKRYYKKWRNTQWKIPECIRKGITFGRGNRNFGPRLDPAYIPTACISGRLNKAGAGCFKREFCSGLTKKLGNSSRKKDYFRTAPKKEKPF